MRDTDDGPMPAKSWIRVLARYREVTPWRSLREVAVTVVPLAALWFAMWLGLRVSVGLTLVLAVPTGLFLVRLFLLQHDCGHDALFRGRAANDWVGRAIGVVTLTPYDCWRRSHAVHHATVGDLDQRGLGDVTTMTVAEYAAASRTARLAYRLYRHPAVMFGLGPSYLFLLRNRLPFGLMRAGWMPWASTMGTNAAAAAVLAALAWLVGPMELATVFLPSIVVAASVGVWLFYVQHQFEETNWTSGGDWSHAEAALHGSSHYDLPPVLRWLTANVGLHHVHHLASRIPSYRLPEVLRDHPELRDVGRITLSESLRCVPLVLWDEGSRRLVSFREARALA